MAAAYRRYFVPLIVVAIEAGAVVALLRQRRRRTRAERVLRESEERFRLMADNAPLMVWTATPDMLCDYVNNTCVEFTGQPIERLLDSGWLQAVHPDDRDGCARTYVPAFDARTPFRMEYRIRRADGVYRWVTDSGVPRYGPDGAFKGYIGSCSDSTERRDAQEALLASQERYALATAAGDVGLWDWKVDTNDLFVDPEINRLLGLDDQEIPNRLDAWLMKAHPEDAATVIALERDGPQVQVHEMEHRMLHKDGSVRWFLSRGSVLRNPDGTPSRVIGTSIDITTRKRGEELIRESQAALEASNREIQHLVGRLIEAQDAERARVARELHDDVSQQLAGLSIAFSALKHRVSELYGDEALQGDLTALQQRTNTLAEHVRLLSHDLHPTVLRHVGLVAALSTYCSEVQTSHGVVVSCTAQGDFESIAPEAALCLYRIAQEALRNVVLHADATRADVGLRRTDEDAEVTITDDGKGFDAAQFHAGGKGLGLLSITERVRLAGGTVSIVAAPTKGTCVRAEIPANARAKTAIPPATSTRVTARGHRTDRMR